MPSEVPSFLLNVESGRLCIGKIELENRVFSGSAFGVDNMILNDYIFLPCNILRMSQTC
jgi:hypothetical protein